MHYLRVGLEFVGRVAVHDRALFHDEHALAQLVGGLHVLLDEQDRDAGLVDPVDLAPCYDPLSHLVYAAGREHVSHVWVAGRKLIENRCFYSLDTAILEKTALLWHNKLVAESIG